MESCPSMKSVVSMPSRASTSLLLICREVALRRTVLCQCPLGLVPHCYYGLQIKGKHLLHIVSMPSRASTSFLQVESLIRQTCQWCCVNALTEKFASLENAKFSNDGVMPSRASTSFLLYVRGCNEDKYLVSMPSRASISFLPTIKLLCLVEEKRCVNALTG